MSRRRRIPLAVQKAVVLLVYVAVAFALFGWRLLPHPGSVVLGSGSSWIYIWSFGWWEHALGHGLNPFSTEVVAVPYGVNLAWTPSAPGLAFVCAPLTALVGPVAAFNVAAVLLPALAAWTAYLLSLELSGSTWASLIGGYLFGFSTANLRQIEPGHLNLSGVFLFPLVALVVLRYVRGDLSGRGLAWRLGLLLAFQLTISTEFALVLTLALAVALALAFALLPDRRVPIRSALLPILAGYGISVVVVAPFVYYLLFDFHSGVVVDDIELWGTDVLAPLVPSYVHELGGSQLVSLQRHVSSRSAYLGLPTLVIVAAYALRWRRSPGVRFLVAAFAAAFVVTLGATLQVYGHRLIPLPWWHWAAHVPALKDALPFRLAVLEALAASVIVAVWAASTRGLVFARPYVLPLLAVAAIVPAAFETSVFTPRAQAFPNFFADGTYRSCLGPGETIAVYPYGGDALVWQARTGFRFRLAQNGLQPVASHGRPLNRFDADPLVRDLTFAGALRPSMDRLLAFASVHGVDRVVAPEGAAFPTVEEMQRFGPVEIVDGVMVAPRCGAPSLRHRNLSRYVARWGGSLPPAGARSNVGWCVAGAYVQVPYGFVPPPAPGTQVASFVEGAGITCAPPPSGYVRRGFAGAAQGVPELTYPYYAPAPARAG